MIHNHEVTVVSYNILIYKWLLPRAFRPITCTVNSSELTVHCCNIFNWFQNHFTSNVHNHMLHNQKSVTNTNPKLWLQNSLRDWILDIKIREKPTHKKTYIKKVYTYLQAVFTKKTMYLKCRRILICKTCIGILLYKCLMLLKKGGIHYYMKAHS
jgi:hypothetical protein